MKICLTGSTGFLGKHLQERLNGDIYLFSRDEDMKAIRDFQPDYIYHCAAEIYEESEMMESNVLLTHRLLETAKRLQNLKAFIAIGSSSEYGRKKHATRETDYIDPQTMYEATKGAATLLCQTYARSYGLPVIIARPYSLYGKHEPRHRFIPTIIRSIKTQNLLKVAPGVHDFLHIDDFIDGLFMLAKNPMPGQIFNFGSGVQTSNEELVSLIEKLMNQEAVKESVIPMHDYDSDVWVADIEKAKTFGWSPKYTLQTGLEQVLEQQPLEVT